MRRLVIQHCIVRTRRGWENMSCLVLVMVLREDCYWSANKQLHNKTRQIWLCLIVGFVILHGMIDPIPPPPLNEQLQTKTYGNRITNTNKKK
jgi:hypothetical protein